MGRAGDEQPGEARACDYDVRPDRFRLARAVLRRHGLAGDVHGLVAQRLLAALATPVLDVTDCWI